MEQVTENTAYQAPNGQAQLPNATAVLVLGICSIVTCFCYGVPGIVCAIIALVLGKKGLEAYRASPDSYTPSSYNNLKAGRICAIIGLILSFLFLIYIIIVFAFVGSAWWSIFSSMSSSRY